MELNVFFYTSSCAFCFVPNPCHFHIFSWLIWVQISMQQTTRNWTLLNWINPPGLLQFAVLFDKLRCQLLYSFKGARAAACLLFVPFKAAAYLHVPREVFTVRLVSPTVGVCRRGPAFMSVASPSRARFHQVHIFLAYLRQVCCQSMIGVPFGFTMWIVLNTSEYEYFSARIHNQCHYFTYV